MASGKPGAVQFQRTRVGPDGRIDVDGRPYTVPHALSRQVIDLRLTAGLIEVLHAGKRVGSMERKPGTDPVIDPAHLPSTDRYFATWTPEVELNWATQIGPHVHEFLAARLAEIKHKEPGYRLASALKKIEFEVGAARLDAACKMANMHGAKALKNIRSILRHGLESSQVAGPVQEATFEHPNIRGPQYYH